jgi:acyl-CoA thioester hydrolase
VSLDPGTIPEPEAFAFESHVRVRFHEVDALGHVNNAAYLNYLEQAAIDHGTTVGLDLARLRDLGGVFVARRHDIVFLRPSFAGDVLRIVTWLGEAQGARVERRYHVFREPVFSPPPPFTGRVAVAASLDLDGELVVVASTEWVFVAENGRPRRIPEAVVALFQADTSLAGQTLSAMDTSPGG